MLIVRSRVTRRRCRHRLHGSGHSQALAFVLATLSRRVGGVSMQRPQRRVSAARTNDVDTDERRDTIIGEGQGPTNLGESVGPVLEDGQ